MAKKLQENEVTTLVRNGARGDGKTQMMRSGVQFNEHNVIPKLALMAWFCTRPSDDQQVLINVYQHGAGIELKHGSPSLTRDTVGWFENLILENLPNGEVAIYGDMHIVDYSLQARVRRCDVIPAYEWHADFATEEIGGKLRRVVTDLKDFSCTLITCTPEHLIWKLDVAESGC